MNKEILSRLVSLAQESAWTDGEEFSPVEQSGGNYDDAYDGGYNAGKIHLARWILDSMEIKWRE